MCRASHTVRIIDCCSEDAGTDGHRCVLLRVTTSTPLPTARLVARRVIEHGGAVSEVEQRYTRLCLRSSNPTRREWSTRRQHTAREELLAWAKAQDFRDRVTEYLNRARVASDGDVQRRFVDIARHYRILAETEASNANRLGDERRARNGRSGSQNRSPDREHWGRPAGTEVGERLQHLTQKGKILTNCLFRDWPRTPLHPTSPTNDCQHAN